MTPTTDYQTYKFVLERFMSLVHEAMGEDVVSIVLYGSVARGEGRPDSDLDVLLVLEDAPESYWKRLRPLLPVLRQLRTEAIWKRLVAQGLFPNINVIVFSQEEADRNRYLYLDMLEDARILVDRGNFFQGRLRKLKRRLTELGTRRIRRNGAWYWDLKPDLAPDEAFTL